MVTVLCNLKPAKMRGVLSAGMVLCGADKDKGTVELLEPPAGAEARRPAPATCPVSRGRRTRRVQSVQEGGGVGGARLAEKRSWRSGDLWGVGRVNRAT